MRTYFLSFLLTFILSSCTNLVTIDNPKDYSINLRIDEKDYKIDPNSNIELKLKKGFHTIFASAINGDSLLNSEIEIVEDGILNITQSTYFIWTDLYCSELDYNNLKSKLNLKDTVKFDGLEFVDIDLELIKDDFIIKKWNYGVSEKMPEEIDLSENETYKIVSKIYTLKQIKEEFNYMGDFDFDGMTVDEINKVLELREKNK